jgi:cathepsin D
MTLTFTSALTILSLLACSIASPVPTPDAGLTIPLTKKFVNREVNANGSADLPWVLATSQQVENKYHSTLSAFEKHAGKPLAGMTSIAEREKMRAGRNAKRAAAGESLIDEQSGSFWQGTISIGTPAQTFNMWVRPALLSLWS